MKVLGGSLSAVAVAMVPHSSSWSRPNKRESSTSSGPSADLCLPSASGNPRTTARFYIHTRALYGVLPQLFIPSC